MNDITILPFVRDRNPASKEKLPRCFWAVAETGDYRLDCTLGRALAQDALLYMDRTGFTPMLGMVISGMVERGKFGGIEIGFMQCIAEAAARGFCVRA